MSVTDSELYLVGFLERWKKTRRNQVFFGMCKNNNNNSATRGSPFIVFVLFFFNKMKEEELTTMCGGDSNGETETATDDTRV